MPPISWTSKWRCRSCAGPPRGERERLGQQVVERQSPAALQRSQQCVGSARSSSSSEQLHLGLEPPLILRGAFS
jgi:hypothetical protein